MFRVSHQGEGIDGADTLDGAREKVRGQPPSRYDVDEIRREAFPSGHTSRSWGRMIPHRDGRVEDEPWPWDAARPAAPGGLACTPQKRPSPRNGCQVCAYVVSERGSGRHAGDRGSTIIAGQPSLRR